ncbi:MAG: nucleotidyltransferase domain-containing protein [Methanoregulaceae archaeon]|nr:nucleotidyltransferase domain-containing protein [Methanoregulaceae archaeon]
MIQKITEEEVLATGIRSVAEDLRIRDGVLALILFGSAARCQQRLFSDIDLCIVPAGDIPGEERLDLKGYGSQTIEIHLLDDLPLAIRFRVVSEGKLAFCKDALALHRVIADIIREYLDSAPLIDMHSRHAIGISR